MIIKMPRGAIPTPRSQLAASEPYQVPGGTRVFVPSGEFPSPNEELAAASPFKAKPAPESFLVWPMSMGSWGAGDARASLWVEEAFAKACAEPRVFIPSEVALLAAAQCASSNFAEFMQTRGFETNGTAYRDGPFNSLDWTDHAILKSAIHLHGPVKVGVGVADFQTNLHGRVTPGTSGWAMFGCGRSPRAEYCASLCGYGSLAELVGLFGQHQVRVDVAPGMPAGPCYALFIWDSIGIIDQLSMLNITGEAWVRTPVTVVGRIGI
jgi:hypothetical protein